MHLKNNIFRKIFRFFRKKNTHSEYNSVERSEISVYSAKMRRYVRVDAYLPPGYDRRKEEKFPVLFFNDAQDMQAVNLLKTLERLYGHKRIQEIIVFAFYPKDRMNEYGTKSTPDYLNRGNKAIAYQHFLTEEFLPFARENYRLSDRQEDFAAAGFSLGGLSAFDTAWHHSDIFGKAGVFSGSFWWRSKAFIPEDPDADRVVHDYVRLSNSVLPLKFWLQTGTRDETADRNNNGIIDSIDDTTDLIKLLREKGYAEENIKYLEVLDGEHNQRTWGEVLGDFLIWAFPH